MQDANEILTSRVYACCHTYIGFYGDGVETSGEGRDLEHDTVAIMGAGIAVCRREVETADGQTFVAHTDTDQLDAYLKQPAPEDAPVIDKHLRAWVETLIPMLSAGER